MWIGGSGVLSCAGHQRFDPVHIELVGSLVRLQFSSLLHVLDRRFILFLVSMNPGAAPVSKMVLEIEFDDAIEVSNSPLPVLLVVLAVAAPAISLAISPVASNLVR